MGKKKEKKRKTTKHGTKYFTVLQGTGLKKKKIVSANCFMFINFTKSSKETHASPGGSFQKAWQAVRPLCQT